MTTPANPGTTMTLSNQDLLTLLDALDSHPASGEDALRVARLTRQLSLLLGTDSRYEVVAIHRRQQQEIRRAHT